MFPFTDDGEIFPLRKEINFTGQVWKPTDPALKWGGAQWLGISWAWQVLWRVMWWRGFWSFWDLPRYVCCIKIGLTFFIFWLFIWAEVIVWDDYYLLVFMHCVSSTFVWFTLVNPQLQVFEMIHSITYPIAFAFAHLIMTKCMWIRNTLSHPGKCSVYLG